MRSYRAILSIGAGLLGLTFAPLCIGSTPPVLKLSDAGGNIVTVDSTGIETFGGVASCIGGVTCSTTSGFPIVSSGSITWSGHIGPFNVGGVVGSTKPALPTPMLDLALQGVTTGGTGGTLTVLWTDINFFGSGFSGMTEGSILSGTGTYTFTSYFDASNLPFGTGTLIGQLGPFTASGSAALPAQSYRPQRFR